MRNLFQNLLFLWHIKYNYIITSFSFLKLHTKILLSFLYYKTRILNQFPKFIFYFITSNINTKIIKFLFYSQNVYTSTIKNSNYFQILLLHLLITIITVIKYTSTRNNNQDSLLSSYSNLFKFNNCESIITINFGTFLSDPEKNSINCTHQRRNRSQHPLVAREGSDNGVHWLPDAGRNP